MSRHLVVAAFFVVGAFGVGPQTPKKATLQFVLVEGL
jgi:hypothetical protein